MGDEDPWWKASDVSAHNREGGRWRMRKSVMFFYVLDDNTNNNNDNLRDCSQAQSCPDAFADMIAGGLKTHNGSYTHRLYWRRSLDSQAGDVANALDL